MDIVSVTIFLPNCNLIFKVGEGNVKKIETYNNTIDIQYQDEIKRFYGVMYAINISL